MARSLLETFRLLSSETKSILSDLSSPLLLSFAALIIAREQTGIERLSAEHIVATLEAAGVAVEKKSVARALARAKDRVSVKKNIDGDNLYCLMTKGEREISPFLGAGLLPVVRIEGGAPRTARLKLSEVLSRLSGLIRICDPYYGIRTLDSLDYIPAARRVRFLTARTTEGGRKLSGALHDFRKERPRVELRKIATPSDLHDRYVVTPDKLLILGHGLKDIGGKESFMITIGRELAPDIIEETISAFDCRWKSAVPL